MWFRRTRMKSSDWKPAWASSTNWQVLLCRRTREGRIQLVHVTGRLPQPTPSTHSYAWTCFMCGALLPKLNCTTSMQSTIHNKTNSILTRQCLWCYNNQHDTVNVTVLPVELTKSKMALKPSQPTWAVSLPVGCYHPTPTIIIYYYYSAQNVISNLPSDEWWKVESSQVL